MGSAARPGLNEAIVCLPVPVCLQVDAAIVFVSGAPNWEYKIRLNNTEVPSSSESVNNIQIDADTTHQNLYLWCVHEPFVVALLSCCAQYVE